MGNNKVIYSKSKESELLGRIDEKLTIYFEEVEMRFKDSRILLKCKKIYELSAKRFI